MSTNGTAGLMQTADADATADEINAKLDRLADVIEDLDRRMESFDDFKEDLGPIAHGALGIAQRQMSRLEEDGILAFGNEVIQVGRTVATTFTPEDVRLLGDNVVSILETVRNLTQKEVLEVADKAAEALGRSVEEKPAGTLKLLKAMRDTEVRRGMTILLGVLRELGETDGSAAVAKTD
jgi:uncharacterized protein YjgD (DUF1641 family)